MNSDPGETPFSESRDRRGEQIDGPPGPPPGFGKGVNDYLNQHVTVSDAKAATFLAGSLAAIAFIGQANSTSSNCHAVLAALILFACSALSAGAALFPRTPHGSVGGHIFWEDIRAHGDRAAYWAAISGLDNHSVERAYASQNFFVSRVLHRKTVFVRIAVALFFAAVIILVLIYLA